MDKQTQKPQTITVELTREDISDLIAFGNRSQMSGREAPRWCELNARLTQAMQNPEPGLELVAKGEPGGSE